MKALFALPAVFLMCFAAGCLDGGSGDDQSSSDPEDDQADCVPFLTCDTSSDTTDTEEDPEDQTWDCIPILTCPQ